MPMPTTHKPESLRDATPTPPVREPVFSVMTFVSAGSVAGPFPKLSQALDYVPDDSLDFTIIYHRADGRDIPVYGWNHANATWILIAEATLVPDELI